MTRNPSLSRVESLWLRLCGVFGADAVRRKYGEEPPPEWADIVGQLNEIELQRGMRRMMNAGKAHVPTLPEFVRYCKAIGQDWETGDSKPETPLISDSRITDEWGAAANMHLLAAVYDYAKQPFTASETMVLVRWKNEWARVMRVADPEEREDGGKALWNNCMAQAFREMGRGAHRARA